MSPDDPENPTLNGQTICFSRLSHEMGKSCFYCQNFDLLKYILKVVKFANDNSSVSDEVSTLIFASKSRKKSHQIFLGKYLSITLGRP